MTEEPYRPPAEAFAVEERKELRRNPLVAALLALIVPGAGQLYTGRLALGLTLWAILFACLLVRRSGLLADRPWLFIALLQPPMRSSSEPEDDGLLRRPPVATLLSLVVPGAVQLYNGRYRSRQSLAAAQRGGGGWRESSRGTAGLWAPLTAERMPMRTRRSARR